MEPLKVGVILSSVREGRRGEAFARWIEAKLSEREELKTSLLDLKEWAFPPYALKDSPTLAEKSYPAESLFKRWFDAVAALDGFVIVTPEYNHGYPGSLKNALDHLQHPWNHKPVALVSYGGFAAGARSVEQLRLVAVELRMVPVREEVNIRLPGLAADEKGWPSEEIYSRKAKAMIDDLLWWMRVTKEGRARFPR